MDTLSTLRDLQATLDNLATIQKALSALPPDLAILEARLKATEKQMADNLKALQTARNQIQTRSKELELAQRDEDRARAAVKGTSQKLQYTAAIRELDEKERLRTTIARQLRTVEKTAQDLEAALAAQEAERAAAQAQFDELHAVFLAEHGNQVEGRKLLQTKQAALEATLPPADLARFHRLAGVRQGRVVVPVENGACSGCNVKLRGPILTVMKEGHTLVTCESCQRILFLP